MNHFESILSKLITINSVSKNEDKILSYIENTLGDKNIYSKGGDYISYKIKGTNSTKCVIINGHVDTVKEGNLELWTYDPFILTAKDNRLYGLGSSDMKSGISVMINMYKYFNKNKPTNDIILSFVGGEEIDGIGSQNFIDDIYKNIKNDYEYTCCIILEPTNNKFAEIGHRGNYFIDISCKINPYTIPKIFEDLSFIEERLIKQTKSDEIGYPSIAFTKIDYEKNILNLNIDVRTSLETHLLILDYLNELSNKYNELNINIIATSNPGYTREDSHIRTILKETYPEIKQQSMKGSSDLNIFTNKYIDTIILGPGNKETIHSRNEYIEVNQMEDNFDILLNLIDKV